MQFIRAYTGRLGRGAIRRGRLAQGCGRGSLRARVRSVKQLKLNEERFLRLLSDFVGNGERLQNCPPAGLIPEEALVADEVSAQLRPHVESGYLRLESLQAPGHERRPSLVITVPGSGPRTVGFVGAHFDVVPANKTQEGWEREPFELTVEDGVLYGRGVTDCLGHVALLTDWVVQLAENNIQPEATIKIVFIANEEEAPQPDIGLDYVVSEGALDGLVDGPLYWLDSADFGPTVGTGGMAMWQLEVQGVSGHSGFAHNCVNALELGAATSLALSAWFADRFPPHADEPKWGFLSSSTLKATTIVADNTKVTKIPGAVTLGGDIRLTPFYDVKDALAEAAAFVERLNDGFAKGEAPVGFPSVQTADGEAGVVRFSANGRFMEGIACDLDSTGLASLKAAMTDVVGEGGVSQFSMTGSLHLVRDLQRRGFDVQITGFGNSRYYHAPNEQASLDHFRQGFQILCELLPRMA